MSVKRRSAATSMGVFARRITKPTELKAALADGLATTVPLLLDVAVDARDYFPPTTPR